jgi:hypothetical protein
MARPDTVRPHPRQSDRRYHDEEPAEETPHWHFHLVLPQDVLHTDDPSNQDATDDPLLSHMTLLQLTDSKASSSLLPGWSGCLGAPTGTVAPAELLPVATSDVLCSRDAVGRSTSFLTTLLRAAPLCAVTGVALC